MTTEPNTSVTGGLSALLAQATPGPWEMHGGWASHKSWTDIRGSNGWWVAETTHLPEDAYKDHDARLIALAPDTASLLIKAVERHPEDKCRGRLRAVPPRRKKKARKGAPLRVRVGHLS